MAELDGHPHLWGKAAQRLAQRGQVGLQRRGELEKNRAQLGSQVASMVEEALHWLGRVAQALDVGQVAAGLDRGAEVIRGTGGPVGERARRGEAVEGVVDL